MGSIHSKKKPKITEEDKVVLVSSQGLTLSFISHKAFDGS